MFQSIWGFRDGSAPITRVHAALAFAGNYVAGAFAGDHMVGASAGFLGVRDGHQHLHSHISGVVVQWQSKAIGLALKSISANGRSIAASTPSKDLRSAGTAQRLLQPHEVGADIVGFEANYGDMNDAINAGDNRRGRDPVDLHKGEPGTNEDGDVILGAGDDGRLSSTRAGPCTGRGYPKTWSHCAEEYETQRGRGDWPSANHSAPRWPMAMWPRPSRATVGTRWFAG